MAFQGDGFQNSAFQTLVGVIVAATVKTYKGFLVNVNRLMGR